MKRLIIQTVTETTQIGGEKPSTVKYKRVARNTNSLPLRRVNRFSHSVKPLIGGTSTIKATLEKPFNGKLSNLQYGALKHQGYVKLDIEGNAIRYHYMIVTRQEQFCDGTLVFKDKVEALKAFNSSFVFGGSVTLYQGNFLDNNGSAVGQVYELETTYFDNEGLVIKE